MLKAICTFFLCLLGGFVGLLFGSRINGASEFFIAGILIMGFSCVVYAISSRK